MRDAIDLLGFNILYSGEIKTFGDALQFEEDYTFVAMKLSYVHIMWVNFMVWL